MNGNNNKKEEDKFGEFYCPFSIRKSISLKIGLLGFFKRIFF